MAQQFAPKGKASLITPQQDPNVLPGQGGMSPDAMAALGMGAGAPPDMGAGAPPDMGAGAPPDMGAGAPPDAGMASPDQMAQLQQCSGRFKEPILN